MFGPNFSSLPASGWSALIVASKIVSIAADFAFHDESEKTRKAVADAQAATAAPGLHEGKVFVSQNSQSR